MAKYKVEISGLNTNLLNSLPNQKTIDLIKVYKETNSKRIKNEIIKKMKCNGKCFQNVTIHAPYLAD